MHVEYELENFFLQLLDLSESFNWKVETKIKKVGKIYIFNTPVGKVRFTKWDHNGEININIIDQVTKLGKLKAYLQGMSDRDKY
jgi:hypothetical protein